METSGRTFVIVWAGLLALLAITVAASFARLGALSPVVSFGIATLKAALICWFYMNLRQESGLIRIVAIGAAAWLLLLLSLSGVDVLTRD